MRVQHDITNYDNSGSFMKISLHKLKNVFRHCHDSIELLFILSGKISIYSNNKTHMLNEDDVYLINRNELHELQSSGCVLIKLEINSAFFNAPDSPFPADARFNCNSSAHHDKMIFYNLKVLIAKLVKKNTENGKFLEIINKAYLYELFYELMNNFRITSREEPSADLKLYDRTNRIINYINTNYSSYISLESLAEKENLSVPYLSRFFKEQTGQTFKNYLNKIRLLHGVNELISTDKNISEIAEEAGFSNARSFVAVFKEEYDDNPNAYRKNNYLHFAHKPENLDYTQIEKSDYLKNLTRYLNTDITSMLPIKTEWDTITSGIINVKKSCRELTHNFKKIFSFGDGRAILYAEIQEMLIEMQRDIGFEYILFHGLFDKSVAQYLLSDDKEYLFNFNRIDKILEFILSINLKPFLKLGIEFKETSYISELLRNPSVINSSLDKWYQFITEFLMHIEWRFGKEEVSSWKFCLQEEYDRNKLLINHKTEDRYKQLYLTTFKAIKSHNTAIKFGPSPLMPYMMIDTPILSEFLEFFNRYKCMPDFFTFKYFPVIAEASEKRTRFLLDKNPDSLQTFINKIMEQLNIKKTFAIPIYLSDWNSSTSNVDLLNDTCFKAAYIVRNIAKNYDRLDSFGYWILSDFNLDLETGDKLFHGGLGLFTKNGIKKPSYYALSFLSRLGNKLIDSGECYMVTGSETGYQIIAYNYSHYSQLYAEGERFDMTFSERYTPFHQTRNIELRLNLSKITNGEYTQKRYRVNRKSGSCFDMWTRMFSQEIYSRDDINILKQHSSPFYQMQTINITNTSLTVNMELEPHEIQLILIEKI